MSNLAFLFCYTPIILPEKLQEIPFGVDAEAPEPIEYTKEQLEELNRDYT